MGRFICPECGGEVDYLPGPYDGEKRLRCKNCGKNLTEMVIKKAKAYRRP